MAQVKASARPGRRGRGGGGRPGAGGGALRAGGGGGAPRPAPREAAEDVSASSIDQTQASATQLTQQTVAAKAQATASAEQARAAAVTTGAAASQAQAALAQVRAAEASVARARLLAAECEPAPRDAEIQTLPHEAGELVSPGATLVRLVDLSEVTATFYLPNAEIGAEAGREGRGGRRRLAGRRVRGHRPDRVARGGVHPRNIQTRTDRDRLVYPIEVVVTNRDAKLRAGMQVTLPGTSRWRGA